ncbi:hypothetical protein TNCV_3212961 [Trichonephila clavipes]|nr:hypothetical protein TNCV_3212961 [Trichonephila clavipes]
MITNCSQQVTASLPLREHNKKLQWVKDLLNMLARSTSRHSMCRSYLKELAYRDELTIQMDLVACLHVDCTSVDPAVLRHVMTADPRRAQAYLDMRGGYFEHLP